MNNSQIPLDTPALPTFVAIREETETAYKAEIKRLKKLKYIVIREVFASDGESFLGLLVRGVN
jgi:hypothetical protein